MCFLDGTLILSLFTLSNLNGFLLCIHSNLKFHILYNCLTNFIPISSDAWHTIRRNSKWSKFELGIGWIIVKCLYRLLKRYKYVFLDELFFLLHDNYVNVELILYIIIIIILNVLKNYKYIYFELLGLFKLINYPSIMNLYIYTNYYSKK